ncbi:GGDEF domain-containing protein [Aquabacterium sp.]|uniref:GGDEF domain-containing protein n=1 Tax=Aquabacterium sp. TaxID=1872578 RepID=UPI0024870780|nr:GGDEF domain-containing protein [Aquabacterium sp.]MDI1258201.1 GGDEF domain-containing protein [Aquabacterium sp.]
MSVQSHAIAQPLVPQEPWLGSKFATFFLTSVPEQRTRIVRSLWSALVVVMCVGLIAYAVHTDVMVSKAGWALSCVMIASNMAFYVALRSGFNLRFADPALTLPQVLAALTWIAGCYGLTGETHGGLLMFVALVLVFGAFNLTPRRARITSLYALLVMGLVMAIKSLNDPLRYQPRVEWAYFIFLLTMVPTVAVLAAHLQKMRQHLRGQTADLVSALARIQDMAARDPLTGLINRRKMLDVLAQHAALSEREMLAFSLAYIDLDHFKQVNDSWGHRVGDEVLRGFADEAQRLLRDTDVMARWGGEEFLVLLPDLPPGSPLMAVERMRVAMAGMGLSASAPALRMTFSAGIAVHRVGETMDETIERADKALYQAKASGRNQIVVASA